MGTVAGSIPVTVLTLVLCALVTLLLGFFKVAFTTLANAPSGVEKEDMPMTTKPLMSDSLALAIFDTAHGIGVGAVVAVTVP